MDSRQGWEHNGNGKVTSFPKEAFLHPVDQAMNQSDPRALLLLGQKGSNGIAAQSSRRGLEL
eukprot:3852293-Amphidinium_carterae.1